MGILVNTLSLTYLHHSKYFTGQGLTVSPLFTESQRVFNLFLCLCLTEEPVRIRFSRLKAFML